MNYKQDSFSLQLPVTRDPAIASSLSVIPGLGQIYNSEPRKGLLFLLVGITNILLLGLLSWSKQLVDSLSALGNELNIRPNGDIVSALSNFHPGSPSMTLLMILFLAFIGYAMRDAYDRAKVVRRNSIYAPVVMHMDEASSGSYLFHAALMATLVVFAFFFLLPTAPKAQVTVIEFITPTIQSPTKPKTHNRADKNAEAMRDPKLKNIVKNPSQNSNTGAAPQSRTPSAKPQTENKPAAASKPAETRKESTPAKTEPAKVSKPVETKPAASAPAPQTAKPNISPIAPQNATTPVPNPIKPPVLLPVAAPVLPQMKAPSAQPRTTMDPSKMLPGLMPASAPSTPSLIPNPAGVAVKSTHGAPQLVASNIVPSSFGTPQPGIALPTRSTGSATPNIIESGSRSNKSDRGTGGPAPKGASRFTGDDLAMVSPVSGGPRTNDIGKARNPGPSTSNTTGPQADDGGDLSKFTGLKPSLPGRDKPGGKNGEPGTVKEGRPGGNQNKAIIDVDYSAYMAALQRRIKRNWYPPKCPDSKKITVRFNIMRDGSLRNLKLVNSSGVSINDQAALKAVSNAAPFAPLPEGSPEDVDIEFKFDYNVFSNSGSLNMRQF